MPLRYCGKGHETDIFETDITQNTAPEHAWQPWQPRDQARKNDLYAEIKVQNVEPTYNELDRDAEFVRYIGSSL